MGDRDQDDFNLAGSAITRARSADMLRGDASAERETKNLPLIFWRVLQKRRWTVLSVFMIVVTVVLIAVAREKRMYRATAMIEIRQENPNIVTVQQLFQLPAVSNGYLATQDRILRSDSLARQVIGQLRLDRTREFNPPGRHWFWEVKAAGLSSTASDFPTDPAHEQAVLARFDGRLAIDPIRESRLVQISFDSRDPRRAADVVNTLTATYIQDNLRNHWEASQQASQWLSQQLDGLKIQLEKSEDGLQHYAENNGLLFLDSDEGSTQNIVDERLHQLQTELNAAEADRFREESVYRLVEAGDYGALPGVFDNRTIQDLTVKLADLETRQARLAQNFTSRYPEMKEIQGQIERIQQLLEQQRQQAVRHIEDDYLAAVRREALVRQAFDEQKRQANVAAGKLVEYNFLKRQVDTNKQIYEGLLERLKEAGVSAGLKASNIRVVDAGVPPVHPVSPRFLLSLAIGSLAGLTFGVGLAFLRERLDNTLKTQEDVESFLHAPALALIPSQPALRQKSGRNMGFSFTRQARHGLSSSASFTGSANGNGWLRADSASRDHAALSEAFRNLRTSVLLSSVARPPQSLVVLSAEPGEGKTTVCANLAISFAQLGKRVLLVEGDLRRPCLHTFFHLPNGRGLVHCLAGDEPWRKLVQPSGMHGLDCLFCGPPPPNPSELLSCERMRELIDEAIAEYNFVLIDSPPLLNVAEGRVLSAIAQGSILVAKGGSTSREHVQRAQLYLSAAGAHLIGVVLNDVDPCAEGYDYRRYSAYCERVGDGHRRAEA